MHHSSETHRFYTNRYHKKECRRCGRPNIVPVTRCGYCDLPLTDSDVRLVGRDLLRDLVSARTPGHSQAHGASERKASLDQPTASHETLCGQGSLPSITSQFKPGAVEELYRCYDFVVIRHPFPVAGVHLSAIPKGTVYDIKQLRRAHIPLLQRMQQQTAVFAAELVNELVATRGMGADAARSYGLLRSDNLPPVGASSSSEEANVEVHVRNAALPEAPRPHTSVTRSRAKELLSSSVFFGFSYPCGFGQVNMHGIAPPIMNYNMFVAPFFYPLKKVLQDLQEFGSVQPFEHDYESPRYGNSSALTVEASGCSSRQTCSKLFPLLSRLKHDPIVEEMKEVDAVVRRALELTPGAQGGTKQDAEAGVHLFTSSRSVISTTHLSKTRRS